MPDYRSVVGLVAASAMLPAAIASTGAGAQEARISSAYTRLSESGCETIRSFEEGGGSEQRCEGHRGIPLFVHDGDGRMDVDAGRSDNDWEVPSPFNHVGDTIEWRLEGSEPFAIIFRYRIDDEGRPAGTRLAVKTVAEEGRGSCLVAWIDGDVAEANVVARERADGRAREFRCGSDPFEWHQRGEWLSRDNGNGPMALFGEPESEAALTIACGGDAMLLGMAPPVDGRETEEIGLSVPSAETTLTGEVRGSGLARLEAALPAGDPFVAAMLESDYLTILRNGLTDMTLPVGDAVASVMRGCRR